MLQRILTDNFSTCCVRFHTLIQYEQTECTTLSVLSVTLASAAVAR